MGLLYPFPVSREEEDFVHLDRPDTPREVHVKTYGLPYLFWGYALAITGVVVFMFILIQAPLLKLAALGDDVDKTLAYSLLATLSLSPFVLFSFFFYEKNLFSKKNQLTIKYKIFGLVFMQEVLTTQEKNPFSVRPYLSSPNIARLKKENEELGHQNKGYYVLYFKDQNQKENILDRHSRKIDLIKLQELLSLPY